MTRKIAWGICAIVFFIDVMADDLANAGYRVKLRDESAPDPAFGNKTPDAEVDGVVHDFKNFDSANDVRGKVYIRIKEMGQRSNAHGVTFNLKNTPATLNQINEGLDDIRLYISNEGLPSSMADVVGLIYPNGSTKFLTKTDIINGAYF